MSWREFRTAISFVTVVPAPRTARPTAAPVGTAARHYAALAPPLSAAASGVAVLLLYPVAQASAPAPIQAVLLVTFFYLLRGVRLIDGFVDLGEGLWLGLGRRASHELVWAAMRSPANGAYGILSGGLLLAWHIALCLSLVTLPFVRLLSVVVVAGGCGPLAVVAAHAGRNRYRADSEFGSFADCLGPPFVLTFVWAGVVAGGWAILAAAWPAAWAAGIVAAQTLAALVTGVATRAMTLRASGAFNGDVIGFATLAGDIAALAAALAVTGAL